MTALYVHSKLLIVDDEHTIIGSANINDRSQLGNRDSEVCLYYQSRDFAKSLRTQLWTNFLGEKVPDWEPESAEMFELWKGRAQKNTEIYTVCGFYDDCFRLAPSDEIKNYADLIDYHRELEPLVEHDVVEAIDELKKIKGVLVNYPTKFLIEETFSQSSLPTVSKEFLAPWNMFI